MSNPSAPLFDDLIRYIDAGVFKNGEHTNGWMVIKHENALLFAVRYLGAPVALLISEYAKELARRHAVILGVDSHPNHAFGRAVQKPVRDHWGDAMDGPDEWMF